MFDVISFLRPHKQAKATQLQDLARQLHAGQALDPDHILEQLDACGATEEQLQAEIERLARVDQLRERIAAAAPAAKRLAAIAAEIDKAQASFDKSAQELRRVRDKHAEEIVQLEALERDAARAKADLLDAANLSDSDRARMEALMQQARDAHEAASVARQDLQHAKHRVADCDRQHPEAQEMARRNRSNPDCQEQAKRWDRAKAARAEQLATAQAAHAAAQAAADQAQAAEDAFRTQLMTGGSR